MQYLINKRNYQMEIASLNDIFKQANILQIILTYLQNKDQCLLSMINKKSYNVIHPNIKKQITKFNQFIQIKTQKTNNKKQTKKNNTNTDQQIVIIKEEQCTIIKTSIFKCPIEIFQTQKYWKYTTDIPYEAQSIQQKFNSGMYSFFVHKQNKKNMFYLNRSLIDKKLDYLTGGFEDQNSVETNYKSMYQGKQLTQNFDFTSIQSLRERQKLILESMENKKLKKENEQKFQLQIGVQNIKNLKRISIILCFGGYFSMGIYEKNRCILHKSDHKYVCRKAAGGRQLNKDKCSGTNIQSMGSQIRRNQEKMHQQNISNILTENFKQLDKSDIIFLQAPGFNKLILINQNEALYKLRNKLRSVCLTAKKANFTEVQKIYEAITKVYLVKQRQSNL